MQDRVHMYPLLGLAEMSFHYYGAPLTTFPRRHFDDGASTITIVVDIIMLGKCMLLVIVSDMVNLMPTLGLMEYIASD